MISKFNRCSRKIKREAHFVRRMELAVLKGWLKIKSTDVVCDIACGDAYYTQILGNQACKLFGIDLDEKRLRSRIYYRENVGLFVSKAETLPFPNSTFDTIFSVCALEHFQDDVSSLREIRRTLKDNGHLVMSVDSYSLPYIPKEYITEIKTRHSINRTYTLESLAQKMKIAHFEITDHKYIFSTTLSDRLIRFASVIPKGTTILSPFLYPLLLFSESIVRSNAHAGYILAVRAIPI